MIFFISGEISGSFHYDFFYSLFSSCFMSFGFLSHHTIKMLTNKRQLKGYYNFQKFLSSLCIHIQGVHFLNSISHYFYLLLLGTQFLSSLKKQNSTIIYVPNFSPALVLATVFFVFNFLFHVGVQSINNVVTVPGGQQSNSAIRVHVSILPRTPLPSRLLHNTGQSPLCYIVGPCWLSISKYSNVSTFWERLRAGGEGGGRG